MASSSTAADELEIVDSDFDLDVDFGDLSLKELAASHDDLNDVPQVTRKYQKPSDCACSTSVPTKLILIA